jgi:hypothetical protein
MTRTWRDFARPDDGGYYEERFSYLSQGDIVLEAPLLLPTVPLLVDEHEGDEYLAAVPLLRTAAMLVSPTCDFRRPSAEYLADHPDENPYQLRQQVVVARVLPLSEWERAQRPEGRADRVTQLRGYDNQRQYMYLPSIGVLSDSMVDFGTRWTLPIDLMLRLERLTQLRETAARQLLYKLVMYDAALVVDRDGLTPPMD